MKTYRVYYNRSEDWPQCWSVDEGTSETEINVLGVRLEAGTCAETRVVAPARRPLVDTRQPSAWLHVSAVGMSVIGGIAVFVGPLGVYPRVEPADVAAALGAEPSDRGVDGAVRRPGQ